ncbi:PspC domain-containing protein [Lactococcus allomyrinae]|uniref:PspC domain-containing protein n=1 Tax=Lactococcus allomyrinae TaxID=2419773 RepID=A0A387BHU8_9LACT|nr:PspC domain-containing protein [Lactococcus allomyrinae]AYG00959.1 PspC domain-containing protein [Lactococcus allomyrinae]
MSKRKLTRSSDNRVIAGTIGGLGEYFGLNRTLINIIRIVVVLGAFGSWGILFIIYLIASLLMTQAKS